MSTIPKQHTKIQAPKTVANIVSGRSTENSSSRRAFLLCLTPRARQLLRRCRKVRTSVQQNQRTPLTVPETVTRFEDGADSALIDWTESINLLLRQRIKKREAALKAAQSNTSAAETSNSCDPASQGTPALQLQNKNVQGSDSTVKKEKALTASPAESERAGMNLKSSRAALMAKVPEKDLSPDSAMSTSSPKAAFQRRTCRRRAATQTPSPLARPLVVDDSGRTQRDDHCDGGAQAKKNKRACSAKFESPLMRLLDETDDKKRIVTALVSKIDGELGGPA